MSLVRNSDGVTDAVKTFRQAGTLRGRKTDSGEGARCNFNPLQ